MQQLCSHDKSSRGVGKTKHKSKIMLGVAAVTGQALNSPNNTVISDWLVCSWEAGQLVPTAVSQMTIGQACLMQKLITIMELKVWLSSQIVSDKSVLPSSTSYVCKTRLALALSDHADNHQATKVMSCVIITNGEASLWGPAVQQKDTKASGPSSSPRMNMGRAIC